jgi:hypothetical protein
MSSIARHLFVLSLCRITGGWVGQAGSHGRPLTATGVELLVVVPLPSCPSRFSPQQSMLPPINRAHVWDVPAVTPAALVIPLT